MKQANLIYKDWIITASFYATIHYVMHYLHRHVRGYNDDTNDPVRPGYRGSSLTGHAHRKKMVQENLRKLLKDYNYLETMSKEARYHDLDMSKVSEIDLSRIEDMVVHEFRILQ